MRRFFETAYVIASIAPLVWLGLVIAQVEGSLVSGIAIGSVIPLLALVSLLLVATLMSSPIPILAGLTWMFG